MAPWSLMVESVLALDLSVASPTCWTCFLEMRNKSVEGMLDFNGGIFIRFLRGKLFKDQRKRVFFPEIRPQPLMDHLRIIG